MQPKDQVHRRGLVRRQQADGEAVSTQRLLASLAGVPLEALAVARLSTNTGGGTLS